METHGFSETEWAAAKAEAKSILVAHAKMRGMIPYSELVANLKSVRLGAREEGLFRLLDEISEEEDAAGRGMLSVVVVHKVGDMQPGKGFFELAKRLGRNTSDILKCWVEELHKVHAHWSKKSAV